MFDFTRQTVIVTGAAGSLGQAVAQAFHAAGARLVLVDRDTARLHQVFPNWRLGADFLFLSVDLTDPISVQNMLTQTLDHFKRIDVLANIAGGFAMGPPLHQTDLETWQFMMDLNAKSVFLACRAVVPHMLERGGGKIINIAARAALAGKAKMAPYIASKAAVVRLSESLAEELKARNINVNCILPGTIDTPANRADMPDADFSKWVAPGALAEVVLFLASDAARAMHGAVVPVYGLS
jgi:NAD(P)-dependent dehydrogenase (short-subunit alcohol dehydrogenase family)